MVEITINNVYSEISGPIPLTIKSKLSPFVPGYQYTYEFKRKRWNGKTSFIENNRFGTGLVPLVVQLLQKERIEVQLIDNRSINTLKLNTTKIPLRDYQLEAVNKTLTNEFAGSFWPRGILKQATGAGKSVTAAAIIDMVKVPTLFLTHRIDLIDQFQNHLTNFKIKSGRITADRKEYNKRVTVASIQTLLSFSKKLNKEKFVLKYFEDPENPAPEEIEMAEDQWTIRAQLNAEKQVEVQKFLNTIEMVIIDEAHLITSSVAGAGLFTKALNMMPNAYIRLGLTATPDLKDEFSNLTTMAGTGDILCDISSQELVEQGYLSPVEVSMYSMPKVSCVNSWPDCYDIGIVSHRARNQKILELARSEPGPTLILVTYVNHGSLLVELGKVAGMDIPFVFGLAKSKERKELAKSLNNGTTKVAIASTIWDEGIDIPNIKTIILAGAGKSSIKNLQRVGRGMRLGEDKDKLHVIDFYDRSAATLLKHSKIRERLWIEQGFKVTVIA